MTKTVSTLTVFCDAEGCTKTWDFEQLERDDGSRVWTPDDYAAHYFVGPEERGLSENTRVRDLGFAAVDASRAKYNLRHCGVDLKANPQTLEPILDQLALGGVSRVSLSGLASIVSS